MTEFESQLIRRMDKGTIVLQKELRAARMIGYFLLAAVLVQADVNIERLGRLIGLFRGAAAAETAEPATATDGPAATVGPEP